MRYRQHGHLRRLKTAGRNIPQPTGAKDCVITDHNRGIPLRRNSSTSSLNKEWKTVHLRKAQRLNGILHLAPGLWEKWLLLPRSAIRRHDILLGFPFATSLLLQLRFQILRDRNRKYEVFPPSRLLLMIELRLFALTFRDVLRRFWRAKLGDFLIPTLFGFSTTSALNLKSSRYTSGFHKLI
jgi:hypothetical protein